MCFCGGGVGHTSTRAATNKFLEDCNKLDVDDGPMRDSNDEEGSEGMDRGSESNDKENECLGGGPNYASGDNEGQGGSGDEDGYLDNDEGSCDEEELEDYGFGYTVDDEDGDDGDVLPDIADDTLGPEDGEGNVDEVNSLSFATF